MRWLLLILLVAIPLSAQDTRTAKRAAVGIYGEGKDRVYKSPPSPMARMRKAREFSAVAEIPEQGFISRLLHGERWYTKRIDFPANQRCPTNPANPQVPIFWAEEAEGRYLEIRLDNPSGYGVDVSAPQGRTIFISWACR